MLCENFTGFLRYIILNYAEPLSGVHRPNVWSNHCWVLSDHCLALDFKPLLRSGSGASVERVNPRHLILFISLIHKLKEKKIIFFHNAPFSCRYKCI